MREMKDSGIEWIGEIPADWEVIALKHIAHSNSEVLNENTDPDYEFDYIDIGSVIYGKGVTEFQHMNFASSPSRARRVVKADDVIISTVRTYLRAVAIIREKNSPQIVSTGFLTLRSKNGIIHPTYLYYAVLSDNFIQNVESQSVGISYPAINSTTISTIKLPIAPYKEQQRIANYLDRKCSQIDTIIARQEEVIEKLKAYKLSVITEAVTKGLNPDVPMKDSGVEWIGEIPEHWTVSALRYGLENIQTGPFGSQLHAEDYIEDGIFVINPANIVEGCIVPDNRCSVTELKAQELSRHILNKGDIIFARRGEMGRCAYFGGSFQQYLCGTGCIKIQCNANLMPEFISWFLQTSCVKQYLTLNSVGTTMANLNTTIISGIPVVFPPISEQEKVVEYIKNKICEIDCVLKNKLSIVEKLTEYKKSLIYEVVTGKKEV